MNMSDKSDAELALTTAGRLYLARSVLYLTQNELADCSGIKLSTIKNYEYGGSEPGAESLRQLLAIGFNPSWIIAGVEPMFNEDPKVLMKLLKKSADDNRAQLQTLPRKNVRDLLKDVSRGLTGPDAQKVEQQIKAILENAEQSPHA